MPELDVLDLQAKVARVLDRWPSAGLAVGVVRDGSLEWFFGHGVADIESKEPITQDTVFGSARSPRPSPRSPCCSCGSSGSAPA